MNDQTHFLLKIKNKTFLKSNRLKIPFGKYVTEYFLTENHEHIRFLNKDGEFDSVEYPLKNTYIKYPKSYTIIQDRMTFKRKFKVMILKKLPKGKEVKPFNLARFEKEARKVIFDCFYIDENLCKITSFTDSIKGTMKNRNEINLGFTRHFKLKKYIKEQARGKGALVLNIIYDLETRKLKNSNEHSPYLLSAVAYIELPNISFEKEYTDCYEYVSDENREEMSRKFLSWIIETWSYFHLEPEDDDDEKYSILDIGLFGFNNNKFDNNFILDEWKKIFIDSIFTSSARNGKITEGRFFVKKGQIKKIGPTVFPDYPWLCFKNLNIYIYDLVKWVPDSTLKQACINYETRKKEDINIVYYNNLCYKEDKTVEYVTMEDFKKITSNNFFMSKFKTLKRKDNKYEILEVIKHYCLIDVKATQDLFKKITSSLLTFIKDVETFFKIKIKYSAIFDYVSPSHFIGIVMKIFLSKDNKKVIFNNIEMATNIFSTHFGGRVNFGILGPYSSEGEIICMDVTSEYPLAMTGYFPKINNLEDIDVGNEINIIQLQKKINYMTECRKLCLQNKTLDDVSYMKILDSFCGFIEVELTPPEDKYNMINFAALPSRSIDSKKLYYTNEKTTRWICTDHLRNLILTNFKIKVLQNEYNIIFNKTDKIFDGLISYLGTKKREAKEDENKALSKLIKLLMNSMAGKLAQKPTHTIEKITFKNSEYESEKFEENSLHKSLHYLASFVNAKAGWIIYSKAYFLQLKYIYEHKSIEEQPGILYADTDSVFFDKALVDESVTFNTSEELGHYDDEKANFSVTWSQHYKGIKRMWVMSKKAYGLVDANGKFIDLKLKGVHFSEIDKFKDEAILRAICQGNSKTINFEGLIRKDRKLCEIFSSNTDRSMFKLICEGNIQKTVAVDKNEDDYFVFNHSLIKGQDELLKFIRAKY